MKVGLQNPYVRLTNASVTPNKWATFDVECADIRKLPSTPVLKKTSVTLTDTPDGAGRTLAITLPNRNPQQWSEALQAYFGRELKISLELPGEVIHSNAVSTTGRTVSWTWPVGEVIARSRTDLTATFMVPPG